MIDAYKKQDEEEHKKNPMHGATNFSRLIFDTDQTLKSVYTEVKSDVCVVKKSEDTNESLVDTLPSSSKREENLLPQERKRKKLEVNTVQREVFLYFFK